MYSIKKPDNFKRGAWFDKGEERKCDICGEKTNYYKHDFESGGIYFSITKCEKCSIREERVEEWKNEHMNEKSTICPWCEYEFEGYEDDYEEMDSEECECPSCGEKFMRTIVVNYSYTTWKNEDDYKDGE